ncbi:DUF721 domain-containing protein [Streptomyces sp. NPDC089799]|uniref:DUF721 domain-containing protein n=1 Tax=Streptomyces sp. NPDC089799 TaxID=3155066 RepID=UPI00342C86DA
MPTRHPLAAAWADIVGPEIAGHLLVVAVDGGQLVVRADSKAWAAQIRLLEPHLVTQLNQHLGHEAVRCMQVLTPQDAQLPAERAYGSPRAGHPPAGRTPLMSAVAAQPGEETTPAPFYAPVEASDERPVSEKVRALARRRARAWRGL